MSIKDSQQLKQLHSRKAKLEVDLEQLDIEQKQAQRRYAEVRNKLSSVLADIEALKKKEIIVTEHAIIRYAERALDWDIEKIKRNILSDEIRKQINALGNGKYPIEGGVKIVVKDNAVVSVV